MVISKKPHRTAGFHENPKKRSQAGFWAVILQFGIWVSGPQQMVGRAGFQDLNKWTDGLGFRTSTDGRTGWVSGPQQMDGRAGFQDLNRQTN